jgi:hypothetical protein
MFTIRMPTFEWGEPIHISRTPSLRQPSDAFRVKTSHMSHIFAVLSKETVATVSVLPLP